MKQSLGRFGFGNASLGFGLFISQFLLNQRAKVLIFTLLFVSLHTTLQIIKMEYKRTFIAIDLKSFYASVETEEEEVNHGFRLRHFHHDNVPFLMPSYDEATTLYVFKLKRSSCGLMAI